ncbi:unnamed protein product, partial [Heterosigma akashiwo]
MVKWLRIFKNHIKRTKPGKRAALIMDNCGAHGQDLSEFEDAIDFKFLPPNTTSRFQPCDAGIIAVLKCRYKYRLLKIWAFTVLEQDALMAEAKTCRSVKYVNGMYGVHQGKPPNVLDALELLQEVWDNDISEECIVRCWLKCTIPSPTQQSVCSDSNIAGAVDAMTSADAAEHLDKWLSVEDDAEVAPVVLADELDLITEEIEGEAAAVVVGGG